MKRIKLFAATVAIALGLGCPAQAQILYKVEKKGSDKTSYLLGTHHFAPLSVIDSISELPGILSGIDRLYGEVEMSKMSDPAVMMGFQQTLMAPADSTLDKVLTPAQLDSVKNVWQEYTGGQIPIEMVYPMKPAVVSTQLAAMMVQKVLPELNPLEGIDNTMQQRAAQIGKPVAGLETVEFQMDMLYNRPVAEQAKDLMETISDVEGEQKKAVELSQAYLNHDIDKILEIMTTMEEKDAATAERMIYARNDNWVKQLTEEMPTASLMVVVGAGHLPGNRGVIEGLRKAGFTVTAVK